MHTYYFNGLPLTLKPSTLPLPSKEELMAAAQIPTDMNVYDSKCDSCPHLNSIDYNGWHTYTCTQGGNKNSGRFIIRGNIRMANIGKPAWCPLVKKEEPKQKTFWEIREDWKNVTPHITWGDFKVGETLIIPPLFNKKRRVVEVKSFIANRLHLKVLQGFNLYTDFLFLDSYDLEAKYLVRPKTLKSLKN